MSRTAISPPGLVWAIAPAKLRHGAARLHGLLSLPLPETKVRLFWAMAEAGSSSVIAAAMAMRMTIFVIGVPLFAGRLVLANRSQGSLVYGIVNIVIAEGIDGSAATDGDNVTVLNIAEDRRLRQ